MNHDAANAGIEKISEAFPWFLGSFGRKYVISMGHAGGGDKK